MSTCLSSGSPVLPGAEAKGYYSCPIAATVWKDSIPIAEVECRKEENARQSRVSLPSLIQGIQAGILG